MKLDHRHVIAACVLVASAAGACGVDRTNGNVRAEQNITSGQSSADGGLALEAGTVVGCKTLAVCSDGQALAIAVAANQGEIDQAVAVLERLQDAELRTFALQMIADHTKLRDAIAAAAAATTTPIGEPLTPIAAQPNAISQKLQTDSRQAVRQLLATTDENVDRAYLEHQLFAHLTTMALMEHVVVPSIASQQLAMAVAGGAPVIKMHQMLALQIQGRLQGLCGGAIVTPDDAGAGDAAPGTDAAPTTDAAPGVDAAPGTDAAADAATLDDGGEG